MNRTSLYKAKKSATEKKTHESSSRANELRELFQPGAGTMRAKMRDINDPRPGVGACTAAFDVIFRPRAGQVAKH